MSPPAFIEKMFANRATADIVAIHPYDPRPDGVVEGVRLTRRALNNAGAGSRPIWITEFGWASGGPSNPFTVSRTKQASNLRETYRKLLAVRSRYGLQGAIWFNLVDQRPPSKDAWYYHTGLFTRDGGAKPSWRAMKCVTTGGEANCG